MTLLASAHAFAGQPEIGHELQCGARVAAVSGQPVVGTVHVKILLVEFQDIHCRKDETGLVPRYRSVDFENLLGSEGIYVSPAMYSPDSDPVYGSVNDYFRVMSNGAITVHAVVINSTDRATGLPQWLMLPSTKDHYEQDLSQDSIFVNAERVASEHGLDVTTSSDTKLAIIYAGNTYYKGGGLNPVTWENRYTMSEVQGRPYNQENPTAHFSRIGIHCHEFAHTLGIGHSSGSAADLMCSGTKNGSVEGNVPAPLNPIARMKVGWVHVVPADSVEGGEVDVRYSLTMPTIYKMKNTNGDYFLIENRRFDRTMTIGATIVPDYNNAAFFPPAGPHGTITQGIFVWRVNALGDVLDPGYSTEGLVYASGRYGRTYPENSPSETDDGVPFPGVSNARILSPWSDPRNPYSKENDYFGSGAVHYTLFAPNTKGGSACGMEILSENRSDGSFRVKFYESNPPNPALAGSPDADSLGVYASGRTVCRDSSGIEHQVLDVGGEVFYRRRLPGGVGAWQSACLFSNGNGGNSGAAMTRAGSTLLVVWQVKATGTGNYVLHARRSTDEGATWSETSSAGMVYGCTDSGPRPSLAGLGNGKAILVYATSSSVIASFSGDGGRSWGAAARVFSFNEVLGGPSISIGSGQHAPPRASIVFSADSNSGEPHVYYAVYDFLSATWGNLQSASRILPAQYTGFTRPCLVMRTSDAGGTGCVVWDATDMDDHGQKVVVCRDVDYDQLGTSFRILSGRSVNELRADELRGVATDLTEQASRHSGVLEFSLEQNYPNPFNPKTVISSQLPVASNVRLVIYDMLGREVAVLVNERRAAGRYQDTFDATGLASGAYVYRLTAGPFVHTRTMLLIK